MERKKFSFHEQLETEMELRLSFYFNWQWVEGWTTVDATQSFYSVIKVNEKQKMVLGEPEWSARGLSQASSRRPPAYP
jgi:hypothetical protein